ncbi:hypothetical protein ACXO8C_06785 [Lactobacillus delbrueckii subsp. bulgaricus]
MAILFFFSFAFSVSPFFLVSFPNFQISPCQIYSQIIILTEKNGGSLEPPFFAPSPPLWETRGQECREKIIS